MSNPYYFVIGGLVIACGTFLVCRAFYQLEQKLYRAEKLLRDSLVDGLPETQVSDEEWERLVERMR
jgi:hypothetical protein